MGSTAAWLLVGGLGVFGGADAYAGGLDRFSVSVGLQGVGAGLDDGGALGVGSASVRVLEPLYVDVIGRTGMLLGAPRYVATVAVGARAMLLDDVVFARLNLVHQHETPFEDYLDAPITATLGVDEAIHHRSGLEAGGGLRYTFPFDVFGMHVDFSGLGSWFPDDGGPKLYGTFETLVTLDLGKPQRR